MSKNPVQESSLGIALHQARRRATMSQQVLAKAAGIHRNVISALEAGRGSVGSFTAAAAVLLLVIGGRSLPAGESLGERLLTLRKRRKLTRRDVSGLAGVSIPAIEALERGADGHLSILEAVGKVIAAGLRLHSADEVSFWSHAATASASEEWYTPAWLLERVMSAVGDFDLDPCSPGRGKSAVKATMHLTVEDDGLAHPWCGRTSWLNPPYGKEIGLWLAKAQHEIAVGNAQSVISLVPARTDTRWWHQNVAGQADVVLLKGRLTFGAATSAAPFPSALLGYGLKEEQRLNLFAAFPDAWHVAL